MSSTAITRRKTHQPSIPALLFVVGPFHPLFSRLFLCPLSPPVSQYLFVRMAPHPPSWYIRQQRAWVAPFAYGGAAAQQQAVVMAAPEGYYRENSRWGSMAGLGSGMRIQISILAVSFCPVLIYYLLLAFQRATQGECAPEAATTTTITGEEPAAGQKLSPPSRGRRWAAHWQALFREDAVQVAIASMSAAASGNAFHSPGTAKKV